MQAIDQPLNLTDFHSLGPAAGPPKGVEMCRLVDQYVAERIDRGEFNGNTGTVVRSVLLSFARHVEGVPVELINELCVDSWISNPDLRPASRHSMITKLRPFVRWLAARDYIPKDYTALIRAPKVPKGMPRHLEGDQVAVLVRAARTSRDRLIVLLMVHLGLRRIEVSRIDMEDLNMRDLLLAVRGKNGRGEVTRVLPITDEVHSAIVLYLADSPTFSGPLVRAYTTPERLHERAIGKMVAQLMARTGIKQFPRDGMSGHALRHSCAQALIDSGRPIRVVQAIMGHESQTTTEIYLRKKYSAEELRNALEGRAYG